MPNDGSNDKKPAAKRGSRSRRPRAVESNDQPHELEAAAPEGADPIAERRRRERLRSLLQRKHHGPATGPTRNRT